MALILDYNSLTTGILNYLKANSSTLNNGVSNVTIIKDFTPDEYTLDARQYPAISINLRQNEQEREELGIGNQSRISVVCVWEIGCHSRAFTSYTALRQDTRLLTANVEQAIRADDTLSGTFINVDIKGVVFNNVVKKEGKYQKNSLIAVETLNFLVNT